MSSGARDLAVEIERFLAEAGPSSAEEIRSAIRARKQIVLRVLGEDERFSGPERASPLSRKRVYRLAAGRARERFPAGGNGAVEADGEAVAHRWLEFVHRASGRFVVPVRDDSTVTVTTRAARSRELGLGWYGDTVVDQERTFAVADLETLHLFGMQLGVVRTAEDVEVIACDELTTLTVDEQTFALHDLSALVLVDEETAELVGTLDNEETT